MSGPAARARPSVRRFPTAFVDAPLSDDPAFDLPYAGFGRAYLRDCDVAARLASVVAERLGVDVDDLTPEVSLTDELAADSLDLADIEIGIEEELGLAVSHRVLADVRAYGDLVAAVLEESRSRTIGWVRQRFGRVADIGVRVDVRRDRDAARRTAVASGGQA